MRPGHGPLLAAVLALAWWSPACRDAAPEPPAGSAGPVLDGGPPARADAVRTPSGAEVTVVGVRRVSPDVLQVDLVAVNGSGASLDLAAEFDGDGGLARAFLLSQDGRARVFVLADDRGAPQCSTPTGLLAPGAQQALFLRFAAPSRSAHRVTLGLPGLAPLAGLEVPAAEGAS